MFEPLKREVFEKHLRDAYDFGADPPLPLEQLALVFTVLALGVSLDLNADIRDARSPKYHSIAQACLTSARFLNVPSLASIQCLHLMSTWQLITHSQTGAFRSWPLLGLAGRMVLSTGIHRGKRGRHIPLTGCLLIYDSLQIRASGQYQNLTSPSGVGSSGKLSATTVCRA